MNIPDPKFTFLEDSSLDNTANVVNAVIMSPDEKRIAVFARSNVIIYEKKGNGFEFVSEISLNIQYKYQNPIFSNDCEHIYFYYDGCIRVINLQGFGSGQQSRIVFSGFDLLDFIAHSPVDDVLLACFCISDDEFKKEYQIFEIIRGHVMNLYSPMSLFGIRPFGIRPTSVAISHKGDLCAIGFESCPIIIYQLNFKGLSDVPEAIDFSDELNRVSNICFSVDGSKIIVSDRQKIIVYDLEKNERVVLTTYDCINGYAEINAIQISPDNKFVVVSVCDALSTSSELVFFEVASRKVIKSIKMRLCCASMRVFDNGQKILSTDYVHTEKGDCERPLIIDFGRPNFGADERGPNDRLFDDL